MIEQIQAIGYKCLQLKSPLATKALNVLVGSNASGKSSLLQTLLLLRQSADESGYVRELRLSGSLYEGGTAMDVLHPSGDYKIQIRIVDGGAVYDFSFKFDRDDTKAKRRQIKAEVPVELRGAVVDKGNRFSYLNAERIGPRVAYPLPPDEFDLAGLVGKHGEYTAGRLAQSSNGQAVSGWSVDSAVIWGTPAQKLDGLDICKELADSEGRLDLVSNLLLSWIIPGAVFEATEDESIDSAPLRFVRDPASTRVRTRATHVGFGLAYTLPIIAGAFGLASDGLLIVENPEAHLHPFSQSRMGVFLALVAASGRQVFVETHSDHVVNGIRLALRYKFIDHEKVIFNHFHNLIDEGRSEIIQIAPDSEGALDDWPPGFFDQIEKDLARL